MNRLDARALFARLASDIPRECLGHLFVTGSLAAAYHYEAVLRGRGINTKDADIVVHPAGDVGSCQTVAQTLLDSGWQKHRDCYSRATPAPPEQLRAIRLYPPKSNAYFVEFLSVPANQQRKPIVWTPVQLTDGWYGLPSFRYLGIAALGRQTSDEGLEYADPAMMAAANLLSHPEVGSARIESGDLRGVLRSAKDLGRVIALARLEGRDGTEAWRERWLAAIKTCFPTGWRQLVAAMGSGLQEMLDDDNAMEDARTTTDIGLLNGLGVTIEQLRVTGRRLMEDVVLPLRTEGTRR
jgi:hypothetical protein